MTMTQAQVGTRTRGTFGGRTRHVAFSSASRLGRTVVDRARTRGSRNVQELVTVIGDAPQAFMRSQRQPDGE